VEQLNTINACPVCEHAEFESFIDLKDWMITKEEFTIVKCSSCGFHFTNPIPAETTIGNYYKSEEYVSHSSSNKGIINRVYSIVRNYTLKQKVKLLSNYTKGNSLLDIGAGTGHFLNLAQTQGYEIQGLEPDEDARKYSKQNFNLSLDTLEELTRIPSDSKDIVTMWHVLEHVYHLKRDLSEIVRVLKTRGYLFVAVPNMDSWDAKFYKSYWAAYDVPRHLYHFQKNTIQLLLKSFGMNCIEILPMKFDAYYVSMLSEKYKNGSVVNGVINGLKSNLYAKNHGYSSQIYVFKKENK
jgi:ubiquinone/menaquinone biosynthesis C-methylase UbiE